MLAALFGIPRLVNLQCHTHPGHSIPKDVFRISPQLVGLLKKGRPPKRAPFDNLQTKRAYIFSEHFLAVSSHTPPALSQLALSVAFVTSCSCKGGAGHGKCQGQGQHRNKVFMVVFL